MSLTDMSASALQERMAALRERSNTSVTSDDKTPTPLWTYLYIYAQAQRECYTPYMGGAKALLKYLEPLSFPNIPDIEKNYRVNGLLNCYELEELAKVFVGYKELKQLPELRTMSKVILYSLINEVNPRLYGASQL